MASADVAGRTVTNRITYFPLAQAKNFHKRWLRCYFGLADLKPLRQGMGKLLSADIDIFPERPVKSR
jgi:hypothetical protein